MSLIVPSDNDTPLFRPWGVNLSALFHHFAMLALAGFFLLCPSPVSAQSPPFNPDPSEQSWTEPERTLFRAGVDICNEALATNPSQAAARAGWVQDRSAPIGQTTFRPPGAFDFSDPREMAEATFVRLEYPQMQVRLCTAIAALPENTHRALSYGLIHEYIAGIGYDQPAGQGDDNLPRDGSVASFARVEAHHIDIVQVQTFTDSATRRVLAMIEFTRIPRQTF